MIDIVAADLDELLATLDGRTVSIAGTERMLAVRGLPVERIEIDAITRLLGVISNPNVALILMMIGVSLAPASIAAVLLSTSPIFSLFLEAIVDKRRITGRALAGTLLAVGGVAVLTS